MVVTLCINLLLLHLIRIIITPTFHVKKILDSIMSQWILQSIYQLYYSNKNTNKFIVHTSNRIRKGHEYFKDFHTSFISQASNHLLLGIKYLIRNLCLLLILFNHTRFLVLIFPLKMSPHFLY